MSMLQARSQQREEPPQMQQQQPPQMQQQQQESQQHQNQSHQFACLYTHQKTQKRKKWKDGRFVVESYGRGKLYDAKPAPGSGNPCLAEVELPQDEVASLLQRHQTAVEGEKYVIQLEGLWVESASSGSRLPSAAPVVSNSMQKLMTSKFRKPGAYRPPNPQSQPGNSNDPNQTNLGKRRRPLQPGDLVRQHYGDSIPPPQAPYNNNYNTQNQPSMMTAGVGPDPNKTLPAWKTPATLVPVNPQAQRHSSSRSIPQQQQQQQPQELRRIQQPQQHQPQQGFGQNGPRSFDHPPTRNNNRNDISNNNSNNNRSNWSNSSSENAPGQPQPFSSNPYERRGHGQANLQLPGPQLQQGQCQPRGPQTREQPGQFQPAEQTHNEADPSQVAPVHAQPPPNSTTTSTSTVHTTAQEPSIRQNSAPQEFVRNSFDPSTFYGLEEEEDDDSDDEEDGGLPLGSQGWFPSAVSTTRPTNINLNRSEPATTTTTTTTTSSSKSMPINNTTATASSAGSGNAPGFLDHTMKESSNQQGTMTNQDLLTLFGAGGDDDSQSQGEDEVDEDGRTTTVEQPQPQQQGNKENTSDDGINNSTNTSNLPALGDSSMGLAKQPTNVEFTLPPADSSSDSSDDDGDE